MVRSFHLAILTLSAALAFGAAARADDIDPEVLKAQAGSWLIAPEDGSKGCRLTFETGEAIGGHPLTGAEACASALPALAGAYAWNFGDDGTLYIIDATRKVLLRFEEDEGSPWETQEGNRMWLLPALGDVDHVPTVRTLAGTWRLQRPDGKVLCKLSLTAETAADGTTGMSPAGDCPSEVSSLKLDLWSTEGFGLVLMGDDGTALSFDMRPDGSFEKSKEDGGKPLLLIRQ